MAGGMNLLKLAWKGASKAGRSLGGTAVRSVKNPVGTVSKIADVAQEQLVTGQRAASMIKPGPQRAKALGMGALFGIPAVAVYDDMFRSFAPEIADPVVRAQVKLHQEATQAALQNQMRLKQQEAMQTLVQLAQRNPQMFSEVSAGRRLPRGGVVFGGRPRYDLLKILANDMVEGVVPRSLNPEQAIMQSLQEMI